MLVLGIAISSAMYAALNSADGATCLGKFLENDLWSARLITLRPCSR